MAQDKPSACICAVATTAAAATLQRLPADFEPFFAVDTRKRKLDGSSSSSSSTSNSSSVSTTQDEIRRETRSRIADLAFRLFFVVFSSRYWDRIYLFLGLSWSVLCPGYMDGAIPIERAQLALLLLLMCAAASAPTMIAAVLKVLFAVRLRSRLLHDDSKHFAVRKSGSPRTVACCLLEDIRPTGVGLE